MIRKIASIALMLVPLAVWGQADTTTRELEQVVVSATHHASPHGEAPAAVETVDGTKMEQTAAANLSEGLGQSLGLRVENTCQNCGSSEVRIGGLGGEYTQILIDSRPICGALAAVYLLEQLPTAMIDRVEIIRGGSALYGAGAIAGVINVITREPLYNSASAGATLRTIGGQATDWNSNFGASVVTEEHQAGLYVYGSTRHRAPYDRDGDGYSELGLLKGRMIGARAFMRTGQYGKLNAEYHNLHEYRRGGDLFDMPSPMAHISEGGEHDIGTGCLSWDFLPADGRQRLSLYAAAQHIDRQSYYGARSDSDPIGTAYGYTKGVTSNEGLRYSISMERLIAAPATISAGIEHSYDYLDDHTLNQPDTLRQRMHLYSAFAQSEWRTRSWTVAAGLRADKHTAVTQPVVNPRVDIRFSPSEHLSIRAGYGSGFRAPQVFDDDLHAGAVQGELYSVSNAVGLRMERSHTLTASADVCAHVLSTDVDLTVELFHTSINDAFALVWLHDDTTTGLRLYERRNTDGATASGINFGVSAQPTPRTSLQAGATVQRCLYKGSGIEYADNQYERRIERSPNVYGYATATHEPLRGLALTASANYTGSMIVYHAVDDDVEQTLTQPFFDIALRVAYTIALHADARLELQCGIQNLLDAYQKDLDSGPERDSKYIYGPTMPRTLYIGAKIEM